LDTCQKLVDHFVFLFHNLNIAHLADSVNV
jgi:hypothetical protein